MDELIKSLRYFITRDFIYMVGGASVIASFLYRFDRLPSEKTHAAMLIFAAAISYVLGHAIQDISAVLLPFMTTQEQVYLKTEVEGVTKNINKRAKRLYEKFTRRKWEDVEKKVYDDMLRCFREFSENEKYKIKWVEYQRLITLQMLGTTMSPCAFLSGILVLTKWLTSHTGFDITLGVVSIILSLGLLCLGWIKGAQGVQFVIDTGINKMEK